MNKDSMCRCGHSYDEHYNMSEEPEEESCLHVISESTNFMSREYCSCLRFTVATDQDLLNATIRLHKAASIIFLVASSSGFVRNGDPCPHGNYPAYPTHAWWCDGCFHELEDAIEEVASFLNKE